MRLIDSHAHLLSEGFDDDREVLLGELAEQMEAVMEQSLGGRAGNRNRGDDSDFGGIDCAGSDF